jgi:hypothetical protein
MCNRAPVLFVRIRPMYVNSQHSYSTPSHWTALRVPDHIVRSIVFALRRNSRQYNLEWQPKLDKRTLLVLLVSLCSLLVSIPWDHVAYHALPTRRHCFGAASHEAPHLPQTSSTYQVLIYESTVGSPGGGKVVFWFLRYVGIPLSFP